MFIIFNILLVLAITLYFAPLYIDGDQFHYIYVYEHIKTQGNLLNSYIFYPST